MSSASAQEVKKLMKNKNIGIVPILHDKTQKLIGVLTDRDLCLGVLVDGKNPKELKAADFMSKNPLTCKAEDDLQKAEDQMKKRQIGRIPIVDERGLCGGTISQADVALKGGQAEEVYEMVREIFKRSARAKVA